MEEKTMINEIVDAFKDKTREYSKSLGADGYDTEIYYVKNNIEKGYSFIDASLEFKDFILKMEYKVNVGIILPKSTLEMRILFKGGKFPIEYSIYDILNIIDKDNFNCYTIPYIPNKETMETSLEYLFDAFIKYKERIVDLFKDDKKYNLLEENVMKQIINILGREIFKNPNPEYIAHMLEIYYFVDAAKFTTGIYAEYVLSGKYKKAIKAYDKISKKSNTKLTIYEERLKEYLKNKKEPVEFLAKDIETVRLAKYYTEYGALQTTLLCLSFFVYAVPWTLFFGAIYNLIRMFVIKGSLYTSNLGWYVVLIAGFVTGIMHAMYNRHFIAKIIHKNKFDEYMKYQTLQIGNMANDFVKNVFQFFVALSVILSMLAANIYIQVNEKNIVLNGGYFNLKGEEIPYEQIECVYKITKAYDEYFGEIEKTEYVILLKDNRKIELIEYIPYTEVEKNVLNILKEKGIEVKTVDYITDIPAVKDIYEE